MSRRVARITAARRRYFRRWRKTDSDRDFRRWILAHRVLERIA